MVVVTAESDHCQLVLCHDGPDGIQIDPGDRARALVADPPLRRDHRVGQHVEGDSLRAAQFGQFVGDCAGAPVEAEEGPFREPPIGWFRCCSREPNRVRSSSSKRLPLPKMRQEVPDRLRGRHTRQAAQEVPCPMHARRAGRDRSPSAICPTSGTRCKWCTSTSRTAGTVFTSGPTAPASSATSPPTAMTANATPSLTRFGLCSTTPPTGPPTAWPRPMA